MSSKKWEKYRIDDGGTLLEEVYHICHLEDAVDIVEDGEIRSTLIWDASILNTTRTCVSWVSANEWYQGSLYGNISFAYDWEALIDGYDLYWVEAMTDYNPTAFRLLLSNDSDIEAEVIPYDPRTDDGPLILKDGKWYRNSQLTSEFMLAFNLNLTNCKHIDFVDHHPVTCSKKGRHCPHLGAEKSRIGSMFLAYILSHNDKAVRRLFLKRDRTGLRPSIEHALGILLRRVEKKPEYYGPLKGADSIDRICSAFLNIYGHGNEETSFGLLEVCNEADLVSGRIETCIRDFFALPDLTFP
jgi:hypothetical protein